MPSPESARLPWREVGVFFLIALAVRLAALHFAGRNDPFYGWTMPGVDQNVFQDQARAIVTGGDGLLRRFGALYYSPLFSYFSALVYAASGVENFFALHLAESVLGAATCALCFVLAGSWTGRAGAWAAGLMLALAGPWLYYEQALLHEGLMLAAYGAMLWGLRTAQLGRRGGAWRLGAAGAACGAAILGRGNALAFMAILPVWILFALRSEGRPGWKGFGWAGAGCFLLGALVALGPMLARNKIVCGHAGLSTANGRVLFYLGNNAQADGLFTYTDRFDQVSKAAEQDAGAWRRAMIEDLHTAPGAIGRNLLRKTFFFFAARDIPDNLNFGLAQRLNPFLRWTPARWEWLVPLGLFGLGLTLARPRRHAREWGLLWIFSALLAGTLILIVPVGRYRIPILIPVAIGAAHALRWFAWAASARQWRRVQTGAAALGVLIAALWPWRGPLIREGDYLMASRGAIEQKRYLLAHRIITDGMQQCGATPKLLGRTFTLARVRDDRATMGRMADALWEARAWGITEGASLAEFFMQEGHPERARLVLKSILNQVPDQPEARRVMGELEKAGK